MRISLAILLLAGSSLACDFCLPGGASEITPYQELFAKHETVALAHFSKRVAKGRVVFATDEALKGKPAARIEVETETTPHPRFRYVLFVGKETEVVLATPPITEFFRRLSKRAPDLAFFLSYLTSPDVHLSSSARIAFAEAPYAEVKKLKLDGASLYRAIGSPRTNPSNRGILFLLLGLDGGKKEWDAMAPRLARKETQKKPGYDGLLAGYLLARPTALDDVVGLVRKTLVDERRLDPTRALLRALRFHERDERVIPRDRIVKMVRSFIPHPDAAELVLFELTRLEDWESEEAVRAMVQRHAKSKPWLEGLAKPFLVRCAAQR